MNKKNFVNYTKKLGLNLNDNQLKQFEIYGDYLLEYNNHTNLTAIKTLEEVYLKHFYDSLTITKIIDLTIIQELLDVGTGAGFPGLALKIAFPHLKITLLDSNNKKIKFLEDMIKKLDLNNVYLVNNRAEEYYKKEKKQFDLVVARAVAPLNILAELCLPLTLLNRYFISMKGKIDEELNNSQYAIDLLGGEIIDIKQFDLPIENAGRSLVLVEKIKTTDNKYPRQYNKIVKTPLQNSSK